MALVSAQTHSQLLLGMRATDLVSVAIYWDNISVVGSTFT